MQQIVWRTGQEDLHDAFAIRQAVFVQEQGFQQEFDEHEQQAWHLVIYEDGRAVATGRIYPQGPDGWKLGRIAVVADQRNRHLGRKLLAEMEQKARSLGGKVAYIGGQTRVFGFYQALGYTVCGPEYLDEGCPHLPLQKQL